MSDKKIIFYSAATVLDDAISSGAFGGNYQVIDHNTTASEFEHAIKKFEHDDNCEVIFVSKARITGWRTKLTVRECAIDFIGTFTEGEIVQGCARLSFPMAGDVK